MDRTDAQELRSAVEWRWSCSASLVQTVPVVVPLEGERTWSVVVHIFALDGCAKADVAYAWSSPMQGSNEPRIFGSLHIGPLNSPMSVVRAKVADELRVARLAMQQPRHHAPPRRAASGPLSRIAGAVARHLM